MTENEKLRALLAEARETLFDLGKKSADGWHYNTGMAQHERKAADLHARIDAALAEPPAECPTCAVSKAFHDVAIAEKRMAEFQLNAARAEIQRLQEERKPSDAHWERIWSICHDGSDDACCKSHEGDD